MMKILNFGSLNIDYVYAVDHFVRPGETLASSRREVFPGGKGLNQSVALARAGADVWHAGGIGLSDGGFLKKMLDDSGVHTDYVREYDTATGHTVIQVDSSGQNCILLFGGANRIQTPEFIDHVLSGFSKGDYLVLQNEINDVDYIMKKAHERGMIIFLNPSPYNKDVGSLPLEYADCFLLNEIEAEDICKSESGNPDTLLDILHHKFPGAQIVLTLGKTGVIYRDGQQVFRHGIYRVPVVDTTAAGDTFTGFFISCLAQDMGAERSLEYASIASSIAVSRKGAAPSIPTLEEVKTTRLEPV